MKKSLKLMVSSVMLASSLLSFVPQQSVGAQGWDEQLVLVRDWMQRSHQEVSQSINEDLNTGDTYTIRWGDTLGTIAQVMRMSIEDLVAINGITDPNFIVAGNLLRFNGLSLENNFEQGLNLALAEESILDNVEETVLAVAEETMEESIEETTAWVEETTVAPLIEETTAAWVEETTVAPLIEETTAAWVEETTAAPVIEETTAAWVEESTAAPIIEETTAAWVEETTAAPIIEETTVTWLEETTQATTEEVTESYSTSFDSSQAREAFDQIIVEKGLSQSEIAGWEMIIQRESGWNPTIANPYSGAYGLPQALPGNKMSSHGADWQTNPYTQLAWMYDYMVNRYGSIQGAVDFWNANHWY